jgi:predicted O-methyltransferase YrrM
MIDLITDKVREQIFEIGKILDKIGERVEGNLICDITSENLIADVNKAKIFNLITLAKGCEKICEIGVNAGHSLLLMVSTNPFANYLVFDLGAHSYTRPCVEYIKSEYPSTKITEVYGDTKLTLINQEGRNEFDLIHIDGGHDTHTVVNDFIYTQHLLKPNGIVVFDDYNYGNIKDVLDYYKDQRVINRVEELIGTDLHYIYKFND